MTVLPDAPIDPATGLPVPTIAVATDGGVSVITDSGAVYDAKAASGSSVGMTLLAEDEATPANSMIARVTSSYNSGYQNGDIKGAFLSDTDDTDLVGGVELVTNGTFDTDVSGWTGGSEATAAISSGTGISEPDKRRDYLSIALQLRLVNTTSYCRSV
jgi:hypothetical protein